MDRTAIRNFLLQQRGAQNKAAAAIEVSPQHLSGFLQHRADSNFSVVKLLALVDYLRAEHGLEVEVETLARELTPDAIASAP